jgi:hypothetical protein
MIEARRYPKVRLNQPWDLLARTVLNNAVSGKLNVVGDLTLAVNAATTTLADPAITRASFIGLMPMTANAADALATLHFDPTGSGSVVVHHANNAQTDRAFRYFVIG